MIKGRTLEVRRFNITKEIANPLNVVHLSDLHGRCFGVGQNILVKAVLKQKPDVVVFTGDMVDAQLDGLNNLICLTEQISKAVPVFAVLGNHEHRSKKADIICRAMRCAGAILLQNETETVRIKETVVNILGLCEQQAIKRSDYLLAALGRLEYENHLERLQKLSKLAGLRLVLSHFPENFAQIGRLSYATTDFDVMFSGHSHGGQIRLPKIGGLYAAGQGLIPTFDAGLFKLRRGPMLVVSAGLGNDTVIARINNPPQIVSLAIKSKMQEIS
jgi:predicted MPP superfamily phosphohydrolase